MEYTPMLLPTVKRLLDERRGSWPEIQKQTGIPYRTIQNIAQGAVQHPSVETVERLHHYLTQPAGDNAA
jgi:predicted transcriptional regulator